MINRAQRTNGAPPLPLSLGPCKCGHALDHVNFTCVITLPVPDYNVYNVGPAIYLTRTLCDPAKEKIISYVKSVSPGNIPNTPKVLYSSNLVILKSFVLPPPRPECLFS